MCIYTVYISKVSINLLCMILVQSTYNIYTYIIIYIYRFQSILQVIILDLFLADVWHIQRMEKLTSNVQRGPYVSCLVDYNHLGPRRFHGLQIQIHLKL